MRKYFLHFTKLILLILLFTSCREKYRLFVGGYTMNQEKGLSVFDFNGRSGEMNLISRSEVGPGPSYFYFSREDSMLYAINEVMEFKGSFGGGLTTLKYDDRSGLFEKLNEILIPYGGPCYISMSPDKEFLFVASYPNGSVSVIKLDGNGIPETITDTILYVKSTPDSSHAHMILADPSGERVYVTDLGLDRIMIYDFDKITGRLTNINNGIVSLPTGSGPRHFTFNPTGTKLYVISELNSTISVFDVDVTGGLKLVQTLSTLDEGFEGESYCADIHLGKDGHYLYGSNRGENTIVVFRVGIDGRLELAGRTSCGGNWPRNFVIDPSGKFLLVGNEKSDYISVFKIDKTTGLLKATEKHFEATSPACLKFIN